MAESVKKPVLLVALGGNAMIAPGQKGTAEEQLANLQVPLRQIARLSRDYRILITHGNGPQVGALMLQQESCRTVPKMPLEVLVAQTQGQIGYMIESVLDGELMRIGIQQGQPLVSLVSYVVVDEHDPAFAEPAKPIGPAFDERPQVDYPVKKTPKGYRRVVASPEPVTVVEKREIAQLIDLGFIVICCGGGGIPVIREARGYHGIDAVIDKDLVSARLAAEVGVEVFVIATDVPGAALHYGGDRESFLRGISVDQARRFQQEGQFPSGSMGPKVEAAVRFVEAGGRRALICATDSIEKALGGQCGTEITEKA
ncbi:MAG: carbamate kinase [Desulfuromonadales bacterium]|nr:carbamate kinase [Desulfuromonadales bacterium]NIR33113.1 carbamate kinase [Desulfuromonadales bacterium]NIS40601.1 carbamate kinase [Desulfuromonadales bacterium]